MLPTCSDNGKSADFLFNCLLVTSHTPHFTLLAPALLRISFEVLFLKQNKIKIFTENQKNMRKCNEGISCKIKRIISKKSVM